MYLCTLKIIGMTGQKTPLRWAPKRLETLDAVCHSGYYRYDRIFTLQHGRQHFYWSRVGPMAISGLALTFPLMNLAAAFGSLVGVGLPRWFR